MTRKPLLISLVAAAALAGCNKENHTIVAGGPDEGNAGANVADSAPVALPPSIEASKIYRCEDNTVLYVDWLSDEKSANVRTEKGGVPTHVVTDTPGTPMKGQDLEVAGASPDRMVVLTRPGKPSVGCKV